MFSLASPSRSSGSSSSTTIGGSIAGASVKSLTGGKRSSKRVSWNEKKRAGMSFVIVIAFFAVFALIIIVEIVMIEEKSKGAGVAGRHGSYGRQMGDGAPDYEEVRDAEYSVEEAVFLKNNRFIKDLKQGKSIQITAALPPSADSADQFVKLNSLPWGSDLPASVERTLPPYPRGSKALDGEWQIVNGTRFKFFVYSAFYDRRGGRLIRVIGATKTRGPEKVWCRFWYPSVNGSRYRSASVAAKVKVIRENWNLKYSACFVLCPITSNHAVPYAVSVVSKLRTPPGNVIRLRNTDQDPDFANRTHLNAIPDSIGVCIKPLHFDYDSALYLLEFLELNALLGVSHFTVYNHTIGQRAGCVLRHYMNEGGQPVNVTVDGAPMTPYLRPTVNVLPWDLRMRSQKEIRTEGLFAALNDCLYRSMYRHQYVALIDLDEFLIPRHNNTLKELMQWFSTRIYSRNTGAYSFQNAFFYLQFADDVLMYERDPQLNNALRAAMVTQRKTRRRTKLHPQKQRSKYICKPEAVVEAGNHFVWEFISGRASLNVPAEAGILHHYRVCEFGGDDCIKTPSTVDRTAHKYGPALVERVDQQYQRLRQSCRLQDIPSAPPAKV